MYVCCAVCMYLPLCVSVCVYGHLFSRDEIERVVRSVCLCLCEFVFERVIRLVFIGLCVYMSIRVCVYVLVLDLLTE